MLPKHKTIDGVGVAIDVIKGNDGGMTVLVTDYNHQTPVEGNGSTEEEAYEKAEEAFRQAQNAKSKKQSQ
jgi:hypothetical protein